MGTTPTRARFVTIDGIDGCGKSVQAERLAAWINTNVHWTKLTQEPTDGPVGQEIRRKLRSGEAFDQVEMALLFAADRAQHLIQTVRPALARGRSVVSDRYCYSSIAYQGLTQGDAATEWVVTLNRHFEAPDLAIILDVPADLASARRVGRRITDSYDAKTEWQMRLARAYQRIELVRPLDPVVHVDGSGSEEEVFARVLAAYRKLG